MGLAPRILKAVKENLACVKCALKLDMGVFQISPFDKGGMLYRPSKDFAKTRGHETSPMGFAALY